MPKRPWMLAELSFGELRSRRPEVAILPFGATEPHNYHLPYATDVIEADEIAERIGRSAFERGADVVVLPTIPYGTETNQREFPLSMNLNPSTLLSILRDLVGSLEQSGMRKCLILNSHGGNTFKGHLRELYGATAVRLFLCNWYATQRDAYRKIFERTDDHAGEMETSLIMHLRPELVDLRAADSTPVAKLRFEALRDGTIELTRPWHLLSKSSGSGDPSAATAEKGGRWLETIVPPIADFVVELSKATIDDRFPFE